MYLWRRVCRRTATGVRLWQQGFGQQGVAWWRGLACAACTATAVAVRCSGGGRRHKVRNLVLRHCQGWRQRHQDTAVVRNGYRCDVHDELALQLLSSCQRSDERRVCEAAVCTTVSPKWPQSRSPSPRQCKRARDTPPPPHYGHAARRTRATSAAARPLQWHPHGREHGTQAHALRPPHQRERLVPTSVR